MLPRSDVQQRGNSFCTSRFFLIVLLLAAAAAYIPGLGGPFLFDDAPNIAQPINAWLSGATGWTDIVWGNHSGTLGRSLSMLSFLGNAATTGLQVLPFKLTNLALHLACGALIYFLLSALLPRDRRIGGHAAKAAFAVSALWLLHPMQVSTVLYVVQRMAQLSTLFTLLGLLAYLAGRSRIEARRKGGLPMLFVAVPLATIAAALSKENGALLPLFCFILEIGYFSKAAAVKRPASVTFFFTFFLALPAATVLIWYSLHFAQLQAGYAGRLFTLRQRLLSEPRVLMDYMGALLLPSGPSLGVYTDDFVASRSLLDPVTTLLSVFGLVTLVAFAWLLRKRIPAFSAGIAFYLAGHVMESTIFPLELYFEHRNYLPSIGFFLAVVGLAHWIYTTISSRSSNAPQFKRIAVSGAVAIVSLLGVATMARAHVWSSLPAIAAQGVQQHPNSLRANLDLANMLQLQGRYDDAQAVFKHLYSLKDNPSAQHVAVIDNVSLQCMIHGEVPAKLAAHLDYFAGAKIQLFEMLAFDNLSNFLQKYECRNLTKEQLAKKIVHVVDEAPQPGGFKQLWYSRFIASRLYLAAGALDLAREQAALAWMTGAADPAVGLYLANLFYVSGDSRSAYLVLKDARTKVKPWDKRNLVIARELDKEFAKTAGGDKLQPDGARL